MGVVLIDLFGGICCIGCGFVVYFVFFDFGFGVDVYCCCLG